MRESRSSFLFNDEELEKVQNGKGADCLARHSDLSYLGNIIMFNLSQGLMGHSCWNCFRKRKKHLEHLLYGCK